MDENKFKSYFIKQEIDLEYDSVYDFEIHYDDYFSESKYIIEKEKYKFKCYGFKDDLDRIVLINDFKSHILFDDKIFLFFGNPGTGKSVTLIATLKYLYEHDTVGTFYIHCKLFNNLIQSNHEKLKTIIKEEIVYLFKNEYSQYIKCCEEIDNYKISSFSTFWDLIAIIEKNLTFKKKKYLFAFDQYDEEEIDPKNNYIKALRSRNDNRLNIIALCSMDDYGIKNYKINKFLHPDFSIKDFVVKEIVNTLNMDEMTIDNGNIFDQTFERIGKTIRNYNILKNIYEKQNEDDLYYYVDDIKKRIKDYLIKFYELDKKINYNFLKCWTNTFYELAHLNDIKDYISFKYFDIRKNQKNDNEFEIIYLYPVVEEIMVEIFSTIFYKNVRINSIFKLLNIDGFAKSYVFEKFIIHKMKPNDNKNKTVFNYFKIDKVIKCDKFVPRDNEKLNKLIKSKENITEGVYLFEQRIFGGKAFDTAIIDIRKNEKNIAYLFQISINRSYKDIFNLSNLETNIKKFLQYFSIVYSLYFDNVYFTYIFDSKNMDNMVRICDIRKMPYMFFDTNEEIFIDTNYKEVELNNNNIKEFFINPVNLSGSNENFHKNKIVGIMNLEQEKGILNFIKNEPFFKIPVNKKVFFDVSKDNINLILEKKLNNKRFFLIKLTREEAEDYYYFIYEKEKNIPKIKKGILNNQCILLFYYYSEKIVIYHLILSNGQILPLNCVPENLIYKDNQCCYEIDTYNG